MPSLSREQIITMIQKHLPDAKVLVEDPRGDGHHLGVKVTSEMFRKKTPIQCHKMVYKALGEHVGTTVHALSVSTQVPPTSNSDTEQIA